MANYNVWVQTEFGSNNWLRSTEVEKQVFSTKQEAKKYYESLTNGFKLVGKVVENGITWEKVGLVDKPNRGNVIAVGRNW